MKLPSITASFTEPSVKRGDQTALKLEIDNSKGKNKFTLLYYRAKVMDNEGSILMFSEAKLLNIPVDSKKFDHTFDPVDPTTFYKMESEGDYWVLVILSIDTPEGTEHIHKIATMTIEG